MESCRPPEVIVIGAMKCATTAVHAYLDAHPDIRMSRLKELNFFNGPERAPHGESETWWRSGQWHRGVGWYAAQFDDRAPIRGECSPAYTSPTFPEVARRMASVAPDVRLVYLVRDPVERAVSQFEHHRREGTERRTMSEALLDPDSQYVARSRYFSRLQPFLEVFPRAALRIVVQERLLHQRRREIAALYDHVGAPPYWDEECHGARHHVGSGNVAIAPAVRRRFWGRVAEDVDRLRGLLGDAIPEWG
ncbi:sulfotransferase family protein [Nocardioides caldifontis]|uniref:sulfotransferase family protein n=1 Tax=Nocardioides caldifontis TaxID=2588938 RepID=UPI0011DF5DEA|nr:sulfotransferase [Nocardioides caldifontis]